MTDDAIVMIISAASGTGKSTLARALVDSDDHTVLSISHTSREIRTGEVDGRDYHFVTESVFRQMIDQGEFLEYAQVYGNYYGTARKSVMQQLDSGSNVILEIEWQGAEQVISKYPSAIRVFLLPPSVDSLRSRLTNRGRDSQGSIEERLALALDDMKQCVGYDHLILNDDFDRALADLRSLVPGNSGRIRPVPQSLLEKLGISA